MGFDDVTFTVSTGPNRDYVIIETEINNVTKRKLENEKNNI